jgi:hypothetical protein
VSANLIFGQMLFRRIRAFEQRRRRDIFVEPNPNQIKVLANGHHLHFGNPERISIIQPSVANGYAG